MISMLLTVEIIGYKSLMRTENSLNPCYKKIYFFNFRLCFDFFSLETQKRSQADTNLIVFCQILIWGQCPVAASIRPSPSTIVNWDNMGLVVHCIRGWQNKIHSALQSLRKKTLLTHGLVQICFQFFVWFDKVLRQRLKN